MKNSENIASIIKILSEKELWEVMVPIREVFGGWKCRSIVGHNASLGVSS